MADGSTKVPGVAAWMELAVGLANRPYDLGPAASPSGCTPALTRESVLAGRARASRSSSGTTQSSWTVFRNTQTG
jgi:hypothetical protein